MLTAVSYFTENLFVTLKWHRQVFWTLIFLFHFSDLLNKAIMEVREKNNKSLTGLDKTEILAQVGIQLERLFSKTSLAPWAQLTQIESSNESSRETSNSQNMEDHCSICLEPLTIGLTTTLVDCPHLFHTHCINSWLVQKNDCPICRTFTLNDQEYPTLGQR